MRRRTKELYTASDVAKFCQVDLKTIHNWAERGTLIHFRTPGRHLRFRRIDLLDFLRRYGYPIPLVLQDGEPKVHLVGDCQALVECLEGFEVRQHANALAGLVEIGREAPDVVVLDGEVSELDPQSFIKAVTSCEELRHVRLVLWSLAEDRKESWLSNGASAVVGKPNAGELRQAVEALTGRNR